MYNWRFLILAFLAALHPISSFAELNSVDGRGECCDNEPTSLLRETRLSYGSHRLWQNSAKDNRLNLNRDIIKNRHREVEFSVVRRSTGERRVADRRSERDIRRVSRVSFRFARDDMRRADTREANRRQLAFTSVEREAHKISSRDISRLERDRVQVNRAISTRANDERNRFFMKSRHESRNRDVLSGLKNKVNGETRNLLQRARDEVMSGDRRDQEIRMSRLSRSLERHDHRDRDETNHELIQNKLKPNRERDSVREMDQGMSRSLERVQRTRGRTGTRHKLSARERDSAHRKSRSLEQRDQRASDRTETRHELRRSELRLSRVVYSQDPVSRVSREIINKHHVRDFSPRSRVGDRTNQRMVRQKRSIERLSSESRYQTRDLEQIHDAERLNEQRVLSSPQNTRVRVESRIDRRSMNNNNRLTTRETANNRSEKSRSESRQMNQRLSVQNDRRIRMHERDMRERPFRSRSLMDIYRERSSVDRREKERKTSANHDERRVNARSSLDEERRQFVDRRQREKESVDRILMMRKESRLKIRGNRSSLDGNLRHTEDSIRRESNSVIHTRNELREARINAREVLKSFDENRRLSLDRRERDSTDRLRNERSESQLNLRKIQRIRDEEERRSFRRDTVIKVLQNSELRDRQVFRTERIRDIRQESREQRSRDSAERSRNIQLERREIRRSIQYDDRVSRAFDRRERIMSVTRLVERSEVLQISRDLNRDVRMNARTENIISSHLKRDNYRIRSDVRFAENRDNFVLRHNTQEGEYISTLNWQYLFYTLQAIYLCGIFAKVLSKDETGKKIRSLPWWTGFSHSLVKVD